MIVKALGGILVYSLLIYATITWGPHRQFFPIQIAPVSAANNVGIFLILGITLWLVYDILRYIVRIITLPMNWLSMGFLHIAVNIGVLYLMPIVFTFLHTGVTLTMGSIVEVGLFTLGLSFVRSFIK